MNYNFRVPAPKWAMDKINAIADMCNMTKSQVTCSLFAAEMAERKQETKDVNKIKETQDNEVI